MSNANTRGRRLRPVAGLLLGACAVAWAVQVDPIEPPTSYEFLLELPAPNEPPPVAQGADELIGVSPEERRQFARYLSKSPLARKRVPNGDGSVEFLVRNRLHAPVTVEFEKPTVAGASVQMVTPMHVTIAALATLDVASVRGDFPMQQGEADFRYSAVIGDPKARHDDRVVYGWPFPADTHARLAQGPGGPTHREAYARYAIDLAVPEGTPVLAARAGTVVFLESRYFESGLDRTKYLARANQVRILHDDGSMASYAHLLPDSIDLEPGQRVEQGQRIGLSGNTGYSSGPHLHFAVQVHRDMEMVSVPFVMRGVPQLSPAP